MDTRRHVTQLPSFSLARKKSPRPSSRSHTHYSLIPHANAAAAAPTNHESEAEDSLSQVDWNSKYRMHDGPRLQTNFVSGLESYKETGEQE